MRLNRRSGKKTLSSYTKYLRGHSPISLITEITKEYSKTRQTCSENRPDAAPFAKLSEAPVANYSQSS